MKILNIKTALNNANNAEVYYNRTINRKKEKFMFDKDAEEIAYKKLCNETLCFNRCNYSSPKHHRCGEWHRCYNSAKDGKELGYNKANERHSPDEHIDKDRTVLGIIKRCNKIRYSLVQWNGEWWYQYGTYNTEVRLIAWYNIPELKES